MVTLARPASDAASGAVLIPDTAQTGRLLMKRLAFLLTLLLALAAICPASAEDTFVIRAGSREEPKIAITMDDCFEIAYVKELFELAQEYHIRVTFFPLGTMIREEDAELWRAIAESDCEIGSHMYKHVNARNLTSRTIVTWARLTQEQLDRVLGYHYEIRCLRPPYGNVTDKNGSIERIRGAYKAAGYAHAVKWDVSETNPAKLVRQVKNGSILLFHARKRDVSCLKTALPQLLEMGFEPVTVSELLGFGEKQISAAPYVFDPKEYFVN